MTIASAVSLTRTRAAAVRRLYYFCNPTGATTTSARSLAVVLTTSSSVSIIASSSSSPRITRMPLLRWGHATSTSCFSLLIVATTSNYYFCQPTRAFLPPPTSFVSRNTSSNSIMNTAAAASSSSSSSAAPTAETFATTTTTNNEQESKGVSRNTVMATIQSALENSWVRQLSSESAENLDKSRHRAGLKKEIDDNNNNNNKTKRPVFNGHYVLVKPTPLPEPRLVLYSSDVANNLLGLTNEQVESDEDFVKWVSGHDVLLPGSESWATPYALSIMGTRYTNNCPYGTGDGYGDGRAISIGEFNGYELQLKGAGTTPFHRGADGRAVLRSSIREFLASEAMHHLGVATTRALSLVVSENETIQRPWYAENTRISIPSIDDPRLSQYSLAQRTEILERLRQTQKADPNILITEKAAITCRVASSFTRIGHLDLFARRVNRSSQQNAAAGTHDLDSIGRFDTSTNEWKELEQMVWHACYREYRTEAYDPYFENGNIAAAATVLLQESAIRLAKMVGNWIRVGFAQGNFNADNCLIAGKTMDYGPFGWMEEYNPVFAKWTGSGEHFGFVNQPSAAFSNFGVLVESVVPVIVVGRGINNDEDAIKKLTRSFLEEAQVVFENEIDQVFRTKLGFLPDQDVGDAVWSDLEPLLRKSRTDWTLFWRQLTYIMRDFNDLSSADYSGMLSQLESTEEEQERKGASPFYEPLTDELRKDWLAWIEQWRTSLSASSSDESGGLAIYERMRTTNPKYVLREWMLVDAYNGAANDEEAELFQLFDLIKRPYDEGSDTEIRKYYRRAPDEVLLSGGTAFMS